MKMFILLLFLALTLTIVLLLYILSFIISNTVTSSLKITSFESGFTSVSIIQKAFSLDFFLLMVVFIIFDVEVVLLVGFIISSPWGFFTCLLIFLFVGLGLWVEWKSGKLSWTS